MKSSPLQMNNSASTKRPIRMSLWEKWGRRQSPVRMDRVIARGMHLFATLTPEQLLASGQKAFFDSIAGTHDVR